MWLRWMMDVIEVGVVKVGVALAEWLRLRWYG